MAGSLFLIACLPRTLTSSPTRRSSDLTGSPCVLLVSALGMIVSHRWRGNSMESTYFSDKYYFYCQGLTLVHRCSQRSVAWLPARSEEHTSALQSRFDLVCRLLLEKQTP